MGLGSTRQREPIACLGFAIGAKYLMASSPRVTRNAYHAKAATSFAVDARSLPHESSLIVDPRIIIRSGDADRSEFAALETRESVNILQTKRLSEVYWRPKTADICDLANSVSSNFRGLRIYLIKPKA